MNLPCTPLENDLSLIISSSRRGVCFALLLRMFLNVENNLGFSEQQARGVNSSYLAESHLCSSYYFQDGFPAF